MPYDRVIEKFGLYFDGIGLNKTCGRLFGIFMTSSEPLSMSKLIELVQISKSTASTELRRLLSMGIIEKALLPDQRADFYQLRKNIWAVNLHQKIEDIRKLQAILDDIPAYDLERSEPLQGMADYCSFIVPELEILASKYMNQMAASGSYRTFDQKWVVEWEKLPALSDAFKHKMAALSKLGIDAFLPIERAFLSQNPKVVQEDQHLSAYTQLQGEELEQAIRRKLEGIFCMDHRLWSPEIRERLANVFYYVITIRKETSNTIDGFVIFMGGGSSLKGEYKITVLAVDEKVRRMGVAGMLVQSLGNIGIPYTKLRASTRPSNTVAIQAYKKWGFYEDLEATKNAPMHFVSGHWIHLVKKEATCR